MISLEGDERLEDKLINVSVSIDGSWSSRGWTARNGVVTVVSIDTGKVLDVVYLSNSCTASQRKEREKISGDHLHERLFTVVHPSSKTQGQLVGS